MANDFKLKTKANIGVSTVGIYTVPPSKTATVIGITLANVSGSGIYVSVGISRTNTDSVKILKDVPIPYGSSLEVMQGNKIVLEQNDSITAISDTSLSLDAAVTILEMS